MLNGSRTDEISTLKQELKRLDDERQSQDTQASSYVHLNETYQKAGIAYLRSRKERDDLRNEQVSLKMLKDAFRIRDELMALKTKLALIKQIPDVPSGWTAEVKELQLKLVAAEDRRDTALNDINSTNKQLEDLKVDPTIIKVKEELSTGASLAACNEVACTELPKLRDELMGVMAELDVIRQRLGANKTTQLADLVISDDAIADLDTLSQKEVQLVDHLNNARKEASDAKENLQLARNEEEECGTTRWENS